jgi:hypothetical protein
VELEHIRAFLDLLDPQDSVPEESVIAELADLQVEGLESSDGDLISTERFSCRSNRRREKKRGTCRQTQDHEIAHVFARLADNARKRQRLCTDTVWIRMCTEGTAQRASLLPRDRRGRGLAQQDAACSGCRFDSGVRCRQPRGHRCRIRRW